MGRNERWSLCRQLTELNNEAEKINMVYDTYTFAFQVFQFISPFTSLDGEVEAIIVWGECLE